MLPDRYIGHGSQTGQVIEAGLGSHHIAATVLSFYRQIRGGPFPSSSYNLIISQAPSDECNFQRTFWSPSQTMLKGQRMRRASRSKLSDTHFTNCMKYFNDMRNGLVLSRRPFNSARGGDGPSRIFDYESGSIILWYYIYFKHRHFQLLPPPLSSFDIFSIFN